MQKCIDRASPEQQTALIDRIVEFVPQLIRDQYGNYVVQYVIELKMLPVNGRIVDALRGSILELSNEKFSSNVIEKVPSAPAVVSRSQSRCQEGAHHPRTPHRRHLRPDAHQPLRQLCDSEGAGRGV